MLQQIIAVQTIDLHKWCFYMSPALVTSFINLVMFKIMYAELKAAIMPSRPLIKARMSYA